MTMQRVINVIDVSHHQRTVDMAAIKAAGIYAVIHKATQGLRYRDPRYAERRKAARAAGLLWGAYHFMDDSDAHGQADNFIRTVNLSDDSEDLEHDPVMLACDYEDYAGRSPTLDQAMTFMRDVDDLPYVQCVLYSGNRIRETLKPARGGNRDSRMIGAADFFQRHRLWLAHYNVRGLTPWPWSEAVENGEKAASPPPGVFLWQFTETGKVAGVSGNCDGNFYPGTLDELKANWGA